MIRGEKMKIMERAKHIEEKIFEHREETEGTEEGDAGKNDISRA
jgi:hypothetical protein